MNITSILLHTHSGIRWLVILAALIALGFFAYAWLGKRKNKKFSRILPATYSGLLDAQAVPVHFQTISLDYQEALAAESNF